MVQTKWTNEQQDEFLELILPCNNQEEYQRALVQFGAKYGRSAELSLDEGENWLRRRAKCRSVYTCIFQLSAPRRYRVGLPFSWVEKKIFDWAENWSPESLLKPEDLNLADLMNRSTYEIKIEIARRQNTQHGMENLF